MTKPCAQHKPVRRTSRSPRSAMMAPRALQIGIVLSVPSWDDWAWLKAEHMPKEPTDDMAYEAVLCHRSKATRTSAKPKSEQQLQIMLINQAYMGANIVEPVSQGRQPQLTWHYNGILDWSAKGATTLQPVVTAMAMMPTTYTTSTATRTRLQNTARRLHTSSSTVKCTCRYLSTHAPAGARIHRRPCIRVWCTYIYIYICIYIYIDRYTEKERERERERPI